MQKITDVQDLKGKRVLVRASLNVPIQDGVVSNSYRIMQTLPTLRYLHEQGARVIVLGHIGRGHEDTLKPVFTELEKYLPIHFGGLITNDEFSARVNLMNDGDLLLAENLRQDDRESDNDAGFAEIIAQYGDMYVDDAFDNVHRNHASMCALAKLLPSYAGLTLAKEVTELSKVMVPDRPSLFLLGGAKFETKMPLVEKYLELYDHVFIGGALANDVFKAQGYEVGLSMVSDVSLVGNPILSHPKLLIPIDVIVEGPAGVVTKAVDAVLPEERIFDCGPQTVAMLTPYIADAKTILWNGPFGNYEAGFITSTEDTAKLIAGSDAFSVVGGGDTVAAIEKLGLNDKLGFVSTGGGAMLTLLEEGTTPALELLK
jgi:phosphoglycerate kinase